MNLNRVVLAGMAAFVVVFGITFALNTGTSLFASMYAGSQAALRPEAERIARLPYLVVVSLFSQIVFAYVYADTYAKNQGIAGAIKLSLVLALIGILPGRIGEWMMYPLDPELPLGLIPYQFFESILSGVIVGLVYKPIPLARPEPIL